MHKVFYIYISIWGECRLAVASVTHKKTTASRKHDEGNMWGERKKEREKNEARKGNEKVAEGIYMCWIFTTTLFIEKMNKVNQDEILTRHKLSYFLFLNNGYRIGV